MSPVLLSGRAGAQAELKLAAPNLRTFPLQDLTFVVLYKTILRSPYAGRSRHTGAAHSSAWFRATPAENHFAKPPLDLSISVSSLLSLFPLGANGRRAFKRNSMLSRSSYGAFLCKASLRSPHMLSVCFCLYFCAGWTGVAHSSATRCVPRRRCGELLCKASLRPF